MDIGTMDITPRRQRGSSRNQRNENPQSHGCFDRNVTPASEPGPVESREEKIAKQVGWVLKHGAEKEGLRISGRGFVGCGDLLSWDQLYRQIVTFPELVAIVTSSQNPNSRKPNFELISIPSLSDHLSEETDFHPLPPFTTPSDELFYTPILNPQNPSHHLIRATHLHSIPLSHPPSTVLGQPLHADQLPPSVVHGTYTSAYPIILTSGGLKPMNGANEIHFFAGDALLEELAILPKRSSGETLAAMSREVDLLIHVDASRSVTDGQLRWFRGREGVLKTVGNTGGVVGLEWWIKVVRRGTGEVVWKPAQCAVDGEKENPEGKSSKDRGRKSTTVLGLRD